jgi:amino acid transporter
MAMAAMANTAVRMLLLDVPAAAIVAGITWMLIRGMKDTARFNTVVTVVSLIVIGFVIVAGGAEVDSNNWYVDCNSSRTAYRQSD